MTSSHDSTTSVPVRRTAKDDSKHLRMRIGLPFSKKKACASETLPTTTLSMCSRSAKAPTSAQPSRIISVTSGKNCPQPTFKVPVQRLNDSPKSTKGCAYARCNVSTWNSFLARVTTRKQLVPRRAIHDKEGFKHFSAGAVKEDFAQPTLAEKLSGHGCEVASQNTTRRSNAARYWNTPESIKSCALYLFNSLEGHAPRRRRV